MNVILSGIRCHVALPCRNVTRYVRILSLGSLRSRMYLFIAEDKIYITWQMPVEGFLDNERSATNDNNLSSQV